ncbi:MAG: type I restriction-modification system subunit M N-terminal domain-containing protein [Firmicutes bacterium]|nr:type I restriction-modification system subunit M N-terminal domain-containing protein [Bacillota bacterium]
MVKLSVHSAGEGYGEKEKRGKKNGNGDLEFADRLWSAANRLRGTVEAAEYKHIILGLLFLKYLSDAFENRHRFLTRAVTDPANTEYYVKEASADTSLPSLRTRTSTWPLTSSGSRPKPAGLIFWRTRTNRISAS